MVDSALLRQCRHVSLAVENDKGPDPPSSRLAPSVHSSDTHSLRHQHYPTHDLQSLIVYPTNQHNPHLISHKRISPKELHQHGVYLTSQGQERIVQE